MTIIDREPEAPTPNDAGASALEATVTPMAATGRKKVPPLVTIGALGLLLLVPIALAMGIKYLDHVQDSVESSGTPALNAEPVVTEAPDPVASVGTDCTITAALSDGASGESVRCLEAKLSDEGYLDTPADDVFDGDTAAAVQAFQQEHGLVVDGIVGPETGRELDVWDRDAEPVDDSESAGPEFVSGATPDDATCPSDGHAAVVDRASQRAWLCDGGQITKVMPMTSASTQPDPGSYEVFAKDMNSSSTLTGRYSTMTHFVAFTKGKYTGARVAFHSVPKYDDGSFVQPLSSVGTAERYGESSGCIRVLPDDSAEIWDWLDIGDAVVVIS